MQIRTIALVDTLDDLVGAGRSRALSASEVASLARLALRARRDESVIVDLLTAGTSASRTNVLSLRAVLGRRPYAPSERHARTSLSLPISPETQLQSRLSANGPLALTHHALSRYIERHAVGVPVASALASLEAEVLGAVPIKEKSAKGDRLWVGPSGTLFVVKANDTTSHGWGPSDIAVTILPRGAREDAHIKHEDAA